jgi:hypothetical protein
MLLHLLACGDVSNAIFTDDADFLAALPAVDRHGIVVPDLADGDDVGELVVVTETMAGSANGIVAYVFDTVDVVRTLPPTARAEDSRTWGPYAIDGGAQAEAEIVRGGAGRFDWSFRCTLRGEAASTAWGTHYAGDTVAQGDGQFTYDAAGVSRCTGDDVGGSIVVDYDNRAGVDLLTHVDAWTDDGSEPVSYDTAYTLDELVGDFQTALDWNVDQQAATERVALRTRWVDGEGGRSDAVVSGGDLGETVERWTQCWDADGAVTWEWDSEGWFPETGDAAACPYDAFAEIDRFG